MSASSLLDAPLDMLPDDLAIAYGNDMREAVSHVYDNEAFRYRIRVVAEHSTIWDERRRYYQRSHDLDLRVHL